MQVRQAKLVGIVYDDGVGVGDVDAVLHNGGGEQHVIVVIHEAHQYLLQLLRVHLSVPNGHTGVGHIAVDEVLDLLQVVYPAAHDIGLSVTAHLKVYGVGNGLSAERREHGLDGVTVWWGSAHDAHVACSHEREL